ncbi:MFS transporter [Salmonella enterica]|nr:MFS transporter [Salmonella enterica]
MGRFRVYALVAAAYLGTFLSTLDLSIVNVALPTLQKVFHSELGGLQWVINVYAICLSSLMLSAGSLGDKYGHKRIWVLSIILFILGSIVCAFANQLNILLWGRAIQGIAGSFLIPGAMPILTHAFPDKKRSSKIIGGWSAFSALALISGPLLGGWLIENYGWESIFMINVPFGTLTIILSIWSISERKYPEHAALDPAGQIASILFLGMLSYSLIEISEYGLLSKNVLIPLFFSIFSLLVFIYIEVSIKRPLFPISLFKSNRELIFLNIVSFTLGFSGYASLFFMSLFLQQVQTDSPSLTGWHLMPQFVITVLISLLFGRFVKLIPLRNLLIIGYFLVGFSLSFMIYFKPDTPYFIIGITLAILGIGMGLSVPGTATMVMLSVPLERAGIASATMNALRQIGMSIGIAILGSIMSINAINKMVENIHKMGKSQAYNIAYNAIIKHFIPLEKNGLNNTYRVAMSSGFGLAMLCAGITSLLAAFILLFISRHKKN